MSVLTWTFGFMKSFFRHVLKDGSLLLTRAESTFSLNHSSPHSVFLNDKFSLVITQIRRSSCATAAGS